MKNIVDPVKLCPAEREACPLVEELASLRKEVAHLRKLIRIDALTKLYNFRHFKEALTTEMERTRRTGLPTGLIIADLDHFKSINDTYGHEVGNMALISAATLWMKQIRQLDIACRYGGEEFAIIMPGTRLAMAAQAAERLRSVLANRPLVVDGHQITLTASFGVDCFQSGEAIPADEFVDRADHYLLKAKKSGRNRVCFDDVGMKDRGTELSVDERRLLFTGPYAAKSNDRDNQWQSKRKNKGPNQNVE